MSKISKFALILTGILLVCVIGAGIVLGVFFSGGSDLSSFYNLFERNNIEIDESAEFELDEISAVTVDCVSGDVLIVEAATARVELKGNIVVREQQEKYLSVYEEAGVLTVKFDVDASFGNLITTDIQMTVYLPGEQLLDLEVFSTSGNFEMQDMAFGDVSLGNTSGNTNITGCSGRSLDISATSGDTYISGAEYDRIGIICQSGSIRVENCTGSLSAHNTSGTINVIETYGTLDIAATSGNVTVDLSGDHIASIDIGVTSGNATLYLDQNAAFHLSAKTTSGNIKSDFNVLVNVSPGSSPVGKSITGEVNGGGENVNITVTSGNIRINEK